MPSVQKSSNSLSLDGTGSEYVDNMNDQEKQHRSLSYHHVHGSVLVLGPILLDNPVEGLKYQWLLKSNFNCYIFGHYYAPVQYNKSTNKC
jgi:hypothetical protein